MDPKAMTDDDWKRRLTPEQYDILRQKGTEYPGTGKLLHNRQSGDYMCAGCGTVLFTSASKYQSSIRSLEGWPSFAAAASNEAVELADDNSFGMHRTEVICRKCGGHLGHVFPDDSSPTGVHYCVSSAAMQFQKADIQKVTDQKSKDS